MKGNGRFPRSSVNWDMVQLHHIAFVLLLASAQQISHLIPSEEPIDVTLYPRVPTTPIYNATLVFIDDFRCTQELSVQATDTNQVAVFPVAGCYPHRIADRAAEKGFVGVLVITKSSSLYYITQVNYWLKATDTIPVYRVIDDGREWRLEDRVTLDQTEEIFFSGTAFVVQIVIISLIIGSTALFKAGVAAKKLYDHYMIHTSFNVGMLVLLLEILSSVFTIVMSIDFLGTVGIINYSVIFPCGRGAILLSLMTTTILWRSYVLAQAFADGRASSVGFRAAKVSIVLLTVVYTIQSLIFMATQGLGLLSSLLFAVDTLIISLLQIIIGASFIRNKLSVLKQLNSENVARSPRAREARASKSAKSARYLALSAIFMFMFAFFTLATAALAILDKRFAYLSWYALGGTYVFGTVTGYYQVLSISDADTSRPRRNQAGIRGTFRLALSNPFSQEK